MRSPECRECGGTLAECRDVAMADNPDYVVRRMRCLDCGKWRFDLTFSIPEEIDASFYELGADRLHGRRESQYANRGKGVYRRSDTLKPADIRVTISVRRHGRNAPKVGRGGWVTRALSRVSSEIDEEAA